MGEGDVVDSPDTSAGAPGRSSPPVRRFRTVLGIPSWNWWVLFALLGGYSVFVAYLSNLRAEGFFTSTWDLGVNQQLLWTTAHGQLLYETPDLEFYGAHSFLQVHSAYVAVLVAPLYAAWPAPLTLLALQAVVFAASGIPLFYLARRTLRRVSWAFAAVVLYLASFAILSGLMYDFHWESFIPVEFLTFFLLVQRRRYLFSLLPLAVGTLTLEVFPFLAGGVLVLFLVERGQALRFNWRSLLKDRSAQLMAGVLVVALIAYLLVRLFQYVVIPSVLGVPSVTGGGPSGLASVFGLGANAVTLRHSIGYWLLLLAALAFLPLFSPRHLILSAPWFYFSVFLSPLFSSFVGGSQALIAVPALTVASIFGLAEIERIDWTHARSFALVLTILAGSVALLALALLPKGSAQLLNYSEGPPFWIVGGLLALAGLVGVLLVLHLSPTRAPTRKVLGPRMRRFAVPTALFALLVTVLILDTALSPFTPENFNATPLPGYQFRASENIMAPEMPWITSFVPPDAQVLASNRLFPYVANNPNAWAVPWFVISPTNPVPHFPFTPSNLPDYVLADAWEFSLLPTFLENDLFNSSVYGLVAYVYYTSYPGTVFLFELDYHGPTAGRELTQRQPVYEYSATNLSVGSAGFVISDPNSSFGRVITSVPVGHLQATAANVWYGPYASFLPGNYSVTFSLKGNASNSSEPSNPIAYVDGTWAGDENISTFFRVPINASELSPTTWTLITIPLRLADPFPTVELRGFLALEDGRSSGSITLNSITVTSDPS